MDEVRDVRYRPATPEDVPKIARLFRQCNPESFWTQLGDEVSETYSRHYSTGPSGLTIVAVADSRVIGACMGTTDPDRERYEFYKHNGWRLLTLIGARAMRDRHAVLVIVRRGLTAATRLGGELAWRFRRRPQQHSRADHTTALQPSTDRSTCYIAVLCVDTSTRGRGIATAMLQEFQRQSAARGFRRCRIGTTESNVAAQRAMKRAGFRPAGHARTGVTYVRDVDAT